MDSNNDPLHLIFPPSPQSVMPALATFARPLRPSRETIFSRKVRGGHAKSAKRDDNFAPFAGNNLLPQSPQRTRQVRKARCQLCALRGKQSSPAKSAEDTPSPQSAMPALCLWQEVEITCSTLEFLVPSG